MAITASCDCPTMTWRKFAPVERDLAAKYNRHVVLIADQEAGDDGGIPH